MEKEVRIQVPEGMQIDKENSTFECIKFKPIEKKRWRDNPNSFFYGYYITTTSDIQKCSSLFLNIPCNYSTFATEKQAKSALAMARISQIMANDERFGGVVTDEEWNRRGFKYTIGRNENTIEKVVYTTTWQFLAFHTEKQRDLFLSENEDLVKDYLMID